MEGKKSFCPKCGQQVSSEMNFCPACHNGLRPANGMPQRGAAAEKKNDHGKTSFLYGGDPTAQLIFTIAAAVVAVIIAIFSFYWFTTWIGYTGSFYNIGDYLRSFLTNFFRPENSFVWGPLVELSSGICALLLAGAVFLRKIKFLPAIACVLMGLSCLFSVIQIVFQIIGSMYYGFDSMYYNIDFVQFLPLIINIIVIFVYLYLAIEFLGFKIMPSPLISLVVVAAVMFVCFVLRLVQFTAYDYFYFPNFVFNIFYCALPVLLVITANFVAYGKKEGKQIGVNAATSTAGNVRSDSRVVEQKAASPCAAVSFCGKCGTPIVPGSAFCGKCGAPVNPPPQG